MIPFIPRKVAQKSGIAKLSAIATPNARLSTSTTAQGSHTVDQGSASSALTTTSSKGKKKEVLLGEEDLVRLTRLSLSEYALWSDPDLRRKIDTAEEGYIPLSYVLRMSPFASLPSTPSEAMVAKALRAHAEDGFDVRLLMSNPSRAIWYGKGPATNSFAGGYEIRTKDWQAVLERARNSSRHDWESQTIYMECVPVQYRSVAGIHRFTESLLRDRYTQASSSSTLRYIQNITLPRHHLDKPTDQPKCKGFALVTLDDLELAEYLLQRWPWERELFPTVDEDLPDEIQNAKRFGFRTLTKSRWDKLNEEYLAYRQRIIGQLAQDEMSRPSAEVHDDDPVVETRERKPAPPIPDTHPPATTLSSSYPLGCLVFVRNDPMHPYHLLTAWTISTSTRAWIPAIFVLATPLHTEQLVSYFQNHPTIQTNGLDATGAPNGNSKPIVVERVEGTREGLYWGKVPEKVRKQAVQKAAAAMDSGSGQADEGSQVDTEAEVAKSSSKHRRKRRRKEGQ
ncbi:hypothetical protein K474DRAFT_1678742 [Panus rudis PR-1116 ss-1]|nr:hypothetical protein K474DRAFT_1678742 [Panus rudis PR-1116 ss-1]